MVRDTGNLASEGGLGLVVDWRPGDVLLGLYELLEVGNGERGAPYVEGGMGRVYRARHRGYGIELAIKVPRPAYFRAERDRARFEREAEVWISLGLHPYICTCFYVRRLEGIPCLFAEYVDGGTLREWIDGGRLVEGGHEQALKRILSISTQLAWALAYAHDDHGLVHRDVKPANVLLTSAGTARLTDFGLTRGPARGGRLIGAPAAGILGTWRGRTPAYCSPEQAAGARLTGASDTWSFGATLLELFEGRPTWGEGPRAPELLAAYHWPPHGDRAIPRLPSALAGLIARCFHPQPRRRPRMAMLAEKLAEVYEHEVGECFGAERPRSAELLADNWNNRALTMLDLGNADEAHRLLSEALEADPVHLEAQTNHRVLAWLDGRIDDLSLVAALDALCATDGASWRALYYTALIQLERGELSEAVRLLDTATDSANASPELSSARELALSAPASFAGCRLALEGHSGPVSSVAVSNDSRHALSGSDDCTVRVWELATGCCLRVLEGHARAVTCVAVSGDGRLAISGSDDATVRVSEVATGRCLRVLEGHLRRVTCVAVSTDGRHVLSGADDRTVRLWELATGLCLRVLEGHLRAVKCVALSADGRHVLSGSDDRTLRLWERASGRCVRLFEGHSLPVTCAAIAADGRSAASGSTDGTIRAWELETGRCTSVMRGHGGPVTSVGLGSDSHRVVSGGDDRTVRVWELPSARCLRTFIGHTSWVTSVAPTADGRSVLSGGDDCVMRVWNLPSLRLNRSLLQLARPVTHAETTASEARVDGLLEIAEQALAQERLPAALDAARAARSVPGHARTSRTLATWRRLASVCEKTGLRDAWSARSLAGHDDWVGCVAVGPDGRHAVSGSDDRTLRLWELASGECLRVLEGHDDRVGAVCVTMDGRKAVTGGDDCTVRYWDLVGGQCARVFEGHEDRVTAASLGVDERLILSASWDRTIRVWELESGRQLHVLRGHEHRVTCACMATDGRHALSGGDDLTVRLWELATGRCVRLLRGHEAWVTSVSLDASGRLALSASDDATVRVWELSSGRCLRALSGHADRVAAVCASADGRFAVSGGDDRTVRLWELSTGRCLRVLEGHGGAVGSVAVSADGRYAVSGSEDRTIGVWELDWELDAPRATGVR